MPYPITAWIPVGSYFVSFRRSAQDMVTTTRKRIWSDREHILQGLTDVELKDWLEQNQ